MYEVTFGGGCYPMVHEMGYTVTGENWIHPDRILDFHVFIYLYSGKMQVIEDGEEYVITPGDTLFLHKGIRHWADVAADPNTKTFWIHFFDNERIPQGTNGYKLQDPKSDIFYPDDYKLEIVLPKFFHAPNSTYLEAKIKELYHEYQSAESYYQITISLLANELLLNLFRMSQKNIVPSKSQAAIQKIIEYLENQGNRKINSKELSEHLQLNYNYLSSIFRKHTSLSITGYHERNKMMRAAALLKTTMLNVSEVGRQVGYNDPLYFSRVFKKVLGKSPTSYMTQVYRMH